MFINFLYELKKSGVPVSLIEWMTLMEALNKGLAYSSLTSFYYLARAVLVKSEVYFDNYDQAFYNYFSALESPADVFKESLQSLRREQPYHSISPEEEELLQESNLKKMSFKMGKIETPSEKQRSSSVAIAKGGAGGAKSGQGGFNPKGGMRIGGKPSGGSAVQVAGGRLYRGYRNDEVIGVRRFEAALRILRQLARNEGPKDEFNLEGTIDATCRNAGKLKIVWDRPRKNKMKILLVMDSGGSMDSYINLCSQLFTAVKRSTHFKELKYYYFHNCIYEDVYVKPACIDDNAIKTYDFLQKHDPDWRLIIVGDASMAPFELTNAGGAIDIDHNNSEPGLIWLERVINHFEHAIWLNPIPARSWDERMNYRAQSIAIIRTLIPMYEMTLDGLSQAVKKLKVRY